MTVIRVHELAKKMGVESKDLILVLEKMGITAKTPSSGLDDKESKSLIEKLKAIRKEKEKDKIKKDAPDLLATGEERRKKAAALIGKFSSTLEKPGAKPKPAPVIPPPPKPEMPAPPVIPPPGQVKPAPVVAVEAAAPADVEATPAAVPVPPAQTATVPAPSAVQRPATAQRPSAPQTPGARRPYPTTSQPPRPMGTGPRPAARPFVKSGFSSPVLQPAQVPASLIPTKPSKKKWQKKGEFETKTDREFREKPSFKKLPDLKTLPTGKRPHKKDDRYAPQTDVAEITKPRKKVVKIQEG